MTSVVTNLELAVGVDKEVPGLQVSVQNIRRVHVLETSQNLVDKVLEMCVTQRLARPDDLMQISLHQLLNHIAKTQGY